MERQLEQKLSRVNELSWELSPRLPYHNYMHNLDVSETCAIYAKKEGLSEKDSFLLQTAGLLHDIFYEKGRLDNEEKSAEIARSNLPDLGYSSNEIEIIARIIMITNRKQKPGDILEKIMYDSDIDCAGRGDFFMKSEQLRLEEGIDLHRWYKEIQPTYLSNIRFYTRTGRVMREEKVKENLEKIIKGVVSNSIINSYYQ